MDLVEEDAQVTYLDASVIYRDGPRVSLSFDPQTVTAAELITRVTSKHAVRDLFVENPPIEEIIARMYDENHL